jgi:hypothetical protein
MSDIDLAAIRARADAATADDRGWAIWPDVTEGGFIHVGTANGVIPAGQFSVPEDVEVNPVAKVYTEEDAEFIARARADVPALLALVDAQAARIDKALVLHYAMEWHEETEAGSGELDLSKPLPPFCAECTDSDYVEAIEDGDTIDAASDVVGWPCATYRALTEDVTP